MIPDWTGLAAVSYCVCKGSRRYRTDFILKSLKPFIQIFLLFSSWTFTQLHLKAEPQSHSFLLLASEQLYWGNWGLSALLKGTFIVVTKKRAHFLCTFFGSESSQLAGDTNWQQSTIPFPYHLGYKRLRHNQKHHSCMGSVRWDRPLETTVLLHSR